MGRKAVKSLLSCKKSQFGLTSYQVQDSCLGSSRAKKKRWSQLGKMAPTFDPSIQEAEEGEPL